MVATAGSMNIKGTMDTSNIDRGFSKVDQGFDKTKGQAKSFGADMKRVSTTVGGLAKKLLFMGLAGTTAMVGLASKAPAVAPAIARMSVSMLKLKISLGEALAPAFERVAGWLEKLAVWVDDNKDKIGEIAGKFLDWAAALGEKLWPVLKDIGNWAADNPGLFAGIVAGLALGPAIITGITSISSLVGVMTGATVSASLLSALGYLALIGGAAYAGFKGAEYLVDKAQAYTGMGTDPDAPTDMSGQTLATRFHQKLWSDISGNDAPWEDPLNPFSPAHDQAIEEIIAGGFNPTENGRYEADTRRAWFLQWWDAIWG